MRMGSLFTGLGLLDVGIAQGTGADLAWYADIDPWCVAQVGDRHPDAVSLGDVSAIDGAALAPIDILALGFPCQDISAAGRRRGITGPKSGLWAHVPRIISEMARHPGVLIVENSSRLVGHGLASVIDDIALLGYQSITWQVIGAVGVGAPHIRERVAIIARRDGLVPHWGSLASARVRGAAWWAPGREPTRTMRPHAKRVDASERAAMMRALGNGAVVPWAEYVGSAAMDSHPVRRDLLGEIDAPRVTGRLPMAGLVIDGDAYDQPRVYYRGDAVAAVRATPLAQLYGQLLPTPTASRRGDCPSERARRSPSLESVGRLLTTPTVHGNHRAVGSGTSGDGLATQVAAMDGSTLLDPQWVAWLMGYQI